MSYRRSIEDHANKNKSHKISVLLLHKEQRKALAIRVRHIVNIRSVRMWTWMVKGNKRAKGIAQMNKQAGRPCHHLEGVNHD